MVPNQGSVNCGLDTFLNNAQDNPRLIPQKQIQGAHHLKMSAGFSISEKTVV